MILGSLLPVGPPLYWIPYERRGGVTGSILPINLLAVFLQLLLRLLPWLLLLRLLAQLLLLLSHLSLESIVEMMFTTPDVRLEYRVHSKMMIESCINTKHVCVHQITSGQVIDIIKETLDQCVRVLLIPAVTQRYHREPDYD